MRTTFLFDNCLLVVVLSKKMLICAVLLMFALAVACRDDRVCDDMPGGVPYKIVNDSNVNLLNFYSAKDIRVYQVNGKDTTHIHYGIRAAQDMDSTLYLYVRAVPIEAGMTFYLQIKGLPVDTLFVNTREYGKKCSSINYDRILCNGKPCPVDQSVIPFLYIIRKTVPLQKE